MALERRVTRRVHHRDCSYVEKDPLRGRAKQQFREDCDVNNLVAKYRKLGVWPSGSPGVYEDSVKWPKDLAEAFAISARAAEQFEALPSGVRRRLGNDPRRLADLSADDLEDLRAYLKRQETLASPVVGGGGGEPPAEPAPAVRKHSKKADKDDQE